MSSTCALPFVDLDAARLGFWHDCSNLSLLFIQESLSLSFSSRNLSATIVSRSSEIVFFLQHVMGNMVRMYSIGSYSSIQSTAAGLLNDIDMYAYQQSNLCSFLQFNIRSRTEIRVETQKRKKQVFVVFVLL